MTSDWLVRTSKNVLMGPFPKSGVIEMIEGGQIGPQDEVCHKDRFWIYLHEEQEVWDQLGIRVPRAVNEDGEVTESIETRTETIPDLLEPEVPEEFDPEQTAILSNRSLREFRPKDELVPVRVEESFQIYQQTVKKPEIRPAGFAPSPPEKRGLISQKRFVGKAEVIGSRRHRPSAIAVWAAVLAFTGIVALFFLLKSLQAGVWFQ